jgi:hypothetical protein
VAECLELENLLHPHLVLEMERDVREQVAEQGIVGERAGQELRRRPR